MVVSKKVELSFKLDEYSTLGKFVRWYEVKHNKTNPETGRRRKGDARKAIRLYLESLLENKNTKEFEEFGEDVKMFLVDNKLPKELQRAKNTLSPDEYENFKTYYEKIQKEEEKNQSS